MASSRRAIVDVFPGSAMLDRQRLFKALEAAFAVTLRPFSEDRDGGDGLIAFGTGGQLHLPADLPPELPVLAAGGDPGRGAAREEVRLLDDPLLDRRLRGIVLEDRVVGSLGPIDEPSTVLAAARSGPVWTVSAGRAPVHRVRSLLAELEPHQVLWSMLSERPIAFVALVQFMRSITAVVDWRPPGLRATFMFDDPNLRWRSYGFIDYRRLLAHADQHGYHAAMATIPLDGTRTHRPTAELFARRTDRLSLLVHGNDHVKEELNSLRDQSRVLSVAAQACRRVASFERRCGVSVDRVMAPPHGLCSEPMTGALGAVGFDALCAEHPLPWTEHLPSENSLAAWRPAEFVGGCAVIPRMPLASSAASIALRAFLDHPLVFYGHHQDLAQGLDRLAEIAAVVNRLGDVRWVSMGEIAHTNWALRVDEGRAAVRPLARRIRLVLPARIRALRVEAPQDLLAQGMLGGWSLDGGPILSFGEMTKPAGELAAWVRLHGPRDVDPRGVEAPAWRPQPKLRRVAVEARDRAMPLAAAAGFTRLRSGPPRHSGALALRRRAS
jgi:hypothetical protein